MMYLKKYIIRSTCNHVLQNSLKVHWYYTCRLWALKVWNAAYGADISIYQIYINVSNISIIQFPFSTAKIFHLNNPGEKKKKDNPPLFWTLSSDLAELVAITGLGIGFSMLEWSWN